MFLPSLRRWLGVLAAVAALLPATTRAQRLPPTLLGCWQASQVAFATTIALPDSVLARLDNPEVADLNQAIFTGEALLQVTFRADSTYDFTVVRDGRTVRAEAGTFRVRQGHLQASSPTSPDGSSFDDQRILRLTRHQLTLSLPAGPELPGVDEEVAYRRVGPYPKAEQLYK